MTALTPQQMRELADRGAVAVVEDIGTARELIAALRTAADQVEAVQYIANAYRFDAETAACIVSVRLDTILTADTAPQEDRDE